MTYPTRITETATESPAAIVRPRDLALASVRAVRGANPWHHAPVVIGELRLGGLASLLPLELPGFLDRLNEALPDVCAELGADGETLLARRPMGALLPALVQRTAVQLQCAAGSAVAFGRILPVPEAAGTWTVLVEYEEEAVGRRALDLALDVVRLALERRPLLLHDAVAELEALHESVRLGPSTRALVDEARRRGIPVRRLNEDSLVQLGTGRHQRRIEAAVTDRTGGLAMAIAKDKSATKRVLDRLGLPVPAGETARDLGEAIEAARLVGYPVILKPEDGNHGRGVSCRLDSPEALVDAWPTAHAESSRVLVERHCEGRDHRVLVVGDRAVACAERVPAHVVGDGRSTVRELIERANRDPRRGEGHARALTRLPMDEATEACLARDGRTLHTVPDAGETVRLRGTANLSTGGTSVDRTDELHPANALACVLAARAVGLDVAGVDVLTDDISVPFAESGGVIIEVNAGPGLRMHTSPTCGRPRDVAAPILDLLYPPGAPVRVPVVAVTGTNGKTTTTRLVAHLLRQDGSRVGFTTTDGVYFEDQRITEGDMTGPVAAAQVLGNPLVDAAVLEVARGGILRAGLGFDECDVGIVLNVSSDHLGLRGVHTLEQLAEVKGVIASAVSPDGWAVLNADDARVLRMRERVRGRVALVSTLPPGNSPAFDAHVAEGGAGARVEDGMLVLHRDGVRTEVAAARDVPLTFGGAAAFQVQNVLAALLAAHLRGMTVEAIRVGLLAFVPSPDVVPGRMNLMRVGRGHVLVDYAHNAAAVEALGEFVRGFDARCRVGVIAAPGDRRDADIRELGRLCGLAFDRVVVKEDEDRRGREPGEVARLLCEGLCLAGMDDDRVAVSAGEDAAVEQAVAMVSAGGLAVVLADDVGRVLEIVRRASPSAVER